MLIPEAESLHAMRKAQALRKARTLNQYTERHMELEEQATGVRFREDTTHQLADEYLRAWPKDFWDD